VAHDAEGMEDIYIGLLAAELGGARFPTTHPVLTARHLYLARTRFVHVELTKLGPIILLNDK
jgi:hypothetical protein